MGIVGVENFSSLFIVIMEPKKTTSKDTTKRITREAVDSKPIYLIFYSNTQTICRKGIKYHMEQGEWKIMSKKFQHKSGRLVGVYQCPGVGVT